MLTETWSKEETHTLCNIPGYKAEHNFRNGRKGGGVSVFVKDLHKIETIDTLNISNNCLESAGVRLIFGNSSSYINILGIYRPPKGNVNEFTESLSEILSDNSFSTNDSIITGDFNICLLNEGHSEITSNFMNMMSSNFYRPIITRPTRYNRRSNTATAIDHIWVNSTNSDRGYIFYCDITDHRPVFCRINVQSMSNNKLIKVKFRDFSQENRMKFTNMIQNINWLSILEGISDLTDQTIKYSDTVFKYYNQCFPVMTKTVGSKRLSKPWITTALHKSINTKHNLYKLVRNTSNHQQDYGRYCNILNRLLKTARLQYYKQKFEASKQNLKQTWAIINSTIKPGKKCTNITKLLYNNETITDQNLIAEALNTHFSGIGLALKNALPSSNNTAFRKYLSPPIQNSFYLLPTTPTEVNRIIKELKNTSVNINIIPPKIMKENSLLISHPISFIFNNMASLGQYPDPLKIACITALFKAGDKLHPNNYRPISSLPILNKIFEKLLHSRLNNFFEQNGIFTDNQYGFRKGKSTSDAVNDLLNNIYQAINGNEYLGAVFLDLSKAFDTVPHDILLQKLEHYGIRGIALNLMKSYLSNRKQFVSLDGNKSSTKEVSIGVPQGSVLDPLLFLIYINDLPRATKKLKSILFADDTTMYTSHKSIRDLADKMSEELLHIRTWLIENSLTLNVNKTYYIVFTRRKVPNDLRITIGPHVLDRQKNGKFLGVTLDEKLTFKEHIKCINSKISKTSGILFRLKHSFPLNVLRSLYLALIYPYLNYCLLAWGSAKMTTLQPIIILQKRLVRLLSGSDFNAHSSPLFKSLNLLKVCDLYKLQCQTFMFKTMIANMYPDFQNRILSIQKSHNYNTRNTLLNTPYCRTNTSQQMLLYQAIDKWNSLPTFIKDKTSLFSFKKASVKYYLDMY